MVFTSTVGTLGVEDVKDARRRGASGPVDETDWVRVDHLFGLYKQSKYVAEHEVLRAAAQGLPWSSCSRRCRSVRRPGAHADRQDWCSTS